MEKFIELFAGLFENTEIGLFNPETKFKDLDEWSSLTALSVILMIDEEYGVTIQANDINNINTIAELYHTVNDNTHK